MNEQVGVASAREFSNSAKDFDEVYRHTIQAIGYAKSIADSAQRLTAEALGMPRRDGKLRVDPILEISGQPAAEMAAESFVATYFMLADELAKLKVVPRTVWERLASVASHTCGHLRAYKFADEVAFAMRDCWFLEDSRFPDTKERPTTESQWRTAGKCLASSLPKLKKRLGELVIPDCDDLQQAMLVERAKATNTDPLKGELMKATLTSTVPCDSGITKSDGKRFLIALSFPGAKREFVAAVAEHLAGEVGRERVLYDKWHEAEFARPRLAEQLPPLYREQSELIAVFLCADYRNSEWCGLEWDAILDLIKKREDDAIMLLRFDDTEIAGLYSTHGYVRIEERPAAEIAEVILTRWRLGGTT